MKSYFKLYKLSTIMDEEWRVASNDQNRDILRDFGNFMGIIAAMNVFDGRAWILDPREGFKYENTRTQEKTKASVV